MVGRIFFVLIASIPLFILYNIASLVISFFMVTADGAKVARDLLFFRQTWKLMLCLFPIIVVGIICTIPSPTPIARFGIGRFRTKIVMLMYSSATPLIGAIVRLIAVAQSHPIDNPGQVEGKALFSLTEFTLELLVVILFAVARFDLRFHVPDGCTGPGQYTAGTPKKEEDQEALFQDVDVKMRLSYGSSVRARLEAEAEEMTLQGVKMWQETGVDRTNATRDEVRQAVDVWKLKPELGRIPIDVKDGELLVYALPVQKSPSIGGEDMPRPPPRTRTWMTRNRGQANAAERMI